MKHVMFRGSLIVLFAVLCSCSPIQNRKIISLDGEWNFCIDSTLSGEKENWPANGLPVALCQIVSVPHTWNTEKGLEKYWGKAWYERKLDISAMDLRKTSRLQFDAVNHDADIYVNGKLAGKHIGSGYNRFYITISEFLKKGENTLTLCVDNSPSRSNIPFLKSFDWAHDGGIYRSVNLIMTDPLAIKDIHVNSVPDGNKGSAHIKINFIDPVIADPPKIKILAIITEENQKTQNIIYDGELAGTYENGSFLTSLSFDTIHPWHFDEPNLYKLSVKLLGNGTVKDEYSVTFGFRSIKVENNRYILNGEPVRLMGVEWMPGSSLENGMAENKEDLEKNLKLMKNVNCIFTRFHWQQDEFVFDWCDRNGILVQEEIPYWGGVTMLNDTLFDTGILHLNEMISNHFNHPSIISWGIGNELAGHDSINISYLKKLYNHARNQDSSRLVTYVSNSLHHTLSGKENLTTDATSCFDMMMFNEYYSTWYGQNIGVVSGELDRIANEYKGKPLTIAEWGICEPAHKGGDERRAIEMAQQIDIYGSKPFIAGAIYFCLNDYRTHMGEDFTYSYPQRVHGVCDIRLTSKPSYTVLKNLSSPLKVSSVVVSNGNANITLTGNTGLPCYSVRNYTLISGNQKITLDEIKPGEIKTISIRADAGEFSIIRPTGFEVIRYKYQQSGY